MDGSLDGWIGGRNGKVNVYTQRRNKNRGYMKLEVWGNAIELYREVWRVLGECHIDFKIRAQIADAAHSVSANIAEGYSRRSIAEYMQHLYVALGSLSEMISRMIALRSAEQVTGVHFENIDRLHYEVENGLWNLLGSLERKKHEGTWISRVVTTESKQ